MILLLLLFLSSGFVSTATMPAGLRQFAEYQPVTPVADTVRGLLSGEVLVRAAGTHELVEHAVECAEPDRKMTLSFFQMRRSAGEL